MEKLQTSFLILAVIALFILGFDWLSTGEAPLPEEGSVTVDLGFNGPIDEMLKYLKPYAFVTLVIALIGIIYSKYQIRNSY